MAQSSILGGNAAPSKARGTGTDVLGPSDSSDSGSDVQGERRFATTADDGGEGTRPVDMDSDTDAAGTGERASAEGDDAREAADISPDRIIQPADALDGAVSIDDPEAADIDELALDDYSDSVDPDAPESLDVTDAPADTGTPRRRTH
jgi:hypothetical protein